MKIRDENKFVQFFSFLLRLENKNFSYYKLALVYSVFYIGFSYARGVKCE